MIPRKHPRFAVRIPIRFTGDHDGAGLVTNLSIGGCCVESADAPVDRKAMLIVYLSMSADNPPVKIEAALVPWTSPPNFGLQFLLLRSEALHQLETYLHRLPPEAQLAL